MAAERFWEIDSLRGIAIILMVISNFVTDIGFFGIYSISAYSGIWLYFARLVVSMFILLAGVSLTLSYSRVRNKKAKEIRKKYLLRGLKIFSWGLAITLVTWVFIRENFVLFGVLHLIGFSIIFGQFLLRSRYLNLFLGAFFILVGLYLQAMAFDFWWLAWLGFRPEGFYSVDYVPVFPWLGLFLAGMFFGSMIYPGGKRRFKIGDFSSSRLTAPLQFLGRNSLKIYLIHQPVLILLLMLISPFPYNLPF